MAVHQLSTVAFMWQIRLTGVGPVADRRHIIIRPTAIKTRLRLSVVAVRLCQVVVTPCAALIGGQIAASCSASRIADSRF